MKRKHVLIGIAAAALYLLMLWLLIVAESASPEATILDLPIALWYSLTTFTTVGYGDVYPVTAAGRLIGAVLQLMSLGVLAAVVGMLLTLAFGRLLPLFRLAFLRKRRWFIFSEINEISETLAAALEAEDKSRVMIFSVPDEGDRTPRTGIRIALNPKRLAAYQKGRGETSVFSVSGDEEANNRLAQDLKDSGVHVYAMTGYEPDRLSDNLTLFDPRGICARLYWSRYPIVKRDENVVIVGDGAYAEALIEQALIFNILAPDQKITYHLIGGFGNFSRSHPGLGAAGGNVICVRARGDESGPHIPEADGAAADRLFFEEGEWNSDLDLYRNADRVIFCMESPAASLDCAAQFRKYCPAKADIYVRGTAPMDGFTAFGAPDEIYTPELVMQTKLNRTAVKLHDIYRSENPAAPKWEELSGFLRRSNLAAADHLQMKLRILLGNDTAFDPATQLPGPEALRRAYEVFLSADNKARDGFRRIEHLRWMRFHLMNNWRYAPARDNALRLHPLLKPYDDLSAEEQARDDYAWELIGQL